MESNQHIMKYMWVIVMNYKFVSLDCLEQFSMHDCDIEDIVIQDRELIIYLSHIDVLPDNRLNNFKIPKQTDTAYVKFKDFNISKIIKDYGVSYDSKNEQYSGYKLEELTSLSIDRIIEMLNNNRICGFEKISNNDCYKYLFYTDPYLDFLIYFEIEFIKIEIGWNEFIQDSWFARNYKLTFKEILKSEKSKMNKIRFIVNHYIALPYAAFAIIGAIISTIFMDIDEVKYLPILITYFIVIGVGGICLLIATPIIRKIEIKLECAKKDFDISSVGDKDEFEFYVLDEELTIKLSSNGIIIDEHLYEFSYFDVSLLFTSNSFLVDLNICFKSKYITEEDCSEMQHMIIIPLTKELIYAIKKYNVIVRNQHELDFIVNNKEIAIKQILTYGKLKI